jgi:hypothetical protein
VLHAEAMLQVLAEHDVDFVIIGGFALSAHGVVRGTMQDVAGVKSYDALRGASVVREVPGAGSFQFAGLDDLVAMEVAAGRPQDEIDVTSLLRARRP